MTAPPSAPPLFPIAHHMTFAYPSPASTIASDTSLPCNVMSPPQEYNEPICPPRSTSSSITAQPVGSGGFQWITGNKPDDFKSKHVMQTVRQTAMGSYLKSAKNQTGKKSRANSEASDKSRSGMSSQGTTETRPIKTPKGKEKSDGENKKILSNQRPQLKSKNQSTSNPDRQVARQSTPSQVSIVVPIMEEMIGCYPFDLCRVPPLVSLGQNLDPFGTMYQSRNPRVNVEALKYKCARYFGTKALGKNWIPECLKYPHAFLSTLYMAAAYDDVVYSREVESLETAALRQDVMHFVGGHLTNPEQSVADHNIIAVSQLILGEVISRTEAGLRYHQGGIAIMIQQRGGLDKLGVNRELASAVSWANLATAILQEIEPAQMYTDYCNSRSNTTYPLAAVTPESPLYRPHGEYVTIKRSAQCNLDAQKLVEDVRTMIEESLDPKSTSRKGNPKLRSLYERITRYPPAQELRGTVVLREEDRRYEAIRLAAIVQARAILDRSTLSGALESEQSCETQAKIQSSRTASRSNDSVSLTLGAQHVTSLTDYFESPTFGSYNNSFSEQSYDFPTTHRFSDSSTQSNRPSLSSLRSSSFDTASRLRASASTSTRPSILQRLRDTLNKTNLSECWSDMAGVLLWIGLVMGAASNECEDKMLRRYFSATTIRTCVMLCFEHPEAIHSTMLKMTNVVGTLGRTLDNTKLARKDSAMSKKRMKI